MNEDIKSLLERAGFLSEDQKRMYAAIFDSLDIDKQNELKQILGEAIDKEEQLKAEAVQDFVSNCENALHEESENLKAEEEQSYHDEADKLLNNL